MAKETVVDESPKLESLTSAQLLQVIAEMQAKSDERLAKVVASVGDAIIESKKPYVNPKDEETAKLFAQNTREQFKRQKRNEEIQHEACPHIAGCNNLSESRDMYGRTDIIWHTSVSTEIIGICANCQRWFYESDPDYMKWRGMQSNHKPSKSGSFQFSDPAEAKRLARS